MGALLQRSSSSFFSSLNSNSFSGQSYKPGYIVPPPPPQPEVTTIDISEWTVSGASLGYQRILAVAAERPIFGQGYDEYSDNNSSGVEFFRTASLTISLLRATGLLLPCYSILQRRREQQVTALS